MVNALIGNEIYDKQDFATEWVTTAWGEITRRQKTIASGSPFKVSSNRITRTMLWNEVPAHSFCLLLSLVNNYSGLSKTWNKKFKAGYNEQGELFELLTKESLEKQFGGWSSVLTGWSRSSPAKLKGVVDAIVNQLGEKKGELEIWASPDANEAGLDLVCYRPFGDNRVGIPVYLFQCASGENWTTKFHTPNIKLWTKVILFAATPQKAFSTPFAVEDIKFRRYCNLVDGFMLDRYRLLMPTGPSRDWLSANVKDRLIKWMEPRISTFPKY